MDNPGWQARRRADKESARYHAPQRGPDGHYDPVEHLRPMDEPFVGGFDTRIPPTPPPKEYIQQYIQSHQNGQPRQASQVSAVPLSSSVSTSSSRVTDMSPIERSQRFKVARMEPHLQFMVGPLLRYDAIDERGVWNGFALIVTSDSGSVYEPHPTLTYKWDPDGHHSPSALNESPFALGPNSQIQHVPGHEIWVYSGNGGSYTFWRFAVQIPLGSTEMKISYNINHGQDLEFYVPGRNQNMRWAAHSCNGFSAGVNPDDFRGPGFKSGYDPLWTDLLAKHAHMPFHVLVGGGDQLYCDSLVREPEMQDWVNMKPEERKVAVLTEEISLAIDRFFFNHYCHSFRNGAFARANSTIPMMNMAGQHIKIDGFGSYPDDLQLAPIFRTIGSRGYFFFLLFQCFINAEVDGVDDRPDKHSNKSLIIGAVGPYIRSRSHSFLASLGPRTWILLLDCRAERKKDQVCSAEEYQKVFARLEGLPQHVEHLVVLVGIPIAYPRMVLLETALESKFNPLLVLGRAGSLGLGGLVNKFNDDAELLDDLSDHWTAKSHKTERNWFIEQLQFFAKVKSVRVSFLSGDVHCAAVGVLKTLSKSKKHTALSPSEDYRYMINVVTSAIVNRPPPSTVISMVSSLATKNHKTMHYADTDESMAPIFTTETNGSARKQKVVMGQRNWCSVNLDQATGDLVFDIRVEKEKGIGTTVGYAVRTPPPRWSTGA
ncbi:hypothetical protein PILCRDRAFT_822082 [Piloderma croceum F 1598]|uniref:PhoD-like phosphatase domain-containing protein n=1 Tax=Piloderma croceum (strain F 1598) TaxID=765440 RepID=A0A0C3BTZ6_PILCF|nr:hypothetical protein PILCRDRAFT_822082 [Piloderma croceum F 1598]